jgi:hypothetical protein
MTRILGVVLVGAGCGLAAGVLFFVIQFAILYARMQADSSGGLGAVSGPLYPAVIAMIVGFVGGAVWQWIRS